MYFGIYKQYWYCRWCGNTYKPTKPDERDGFCCPACKQALHRARKKSINWKKGIREKRGKYKKPALPEKQGNVKLKNPRAHKRNVKKSKKQKKDRSEPVKQV